MANMESDTDDSSEDETLARIKSVVVSGQEVSGFASQVALQGKQKFHKTATGGSLPAGKLSQPAPASETAAEDSSSVQDKDVPLEDAYRTGTDMQSLGIIERRIAAALDKRIERLLPPPDGSASAKPSASVQDDVPGKQDSQNERGRDLGCGVRLFRRSKRNVAVLLPPEPEQAGTGGPGRKRCLADELLDGVCARRIRAEMGLLQNLLTHAPSAPNSLHGTASHPSIPRELTQGPGSTNRAEQQTGKPDKKANGQAQQDAAVQDGGEEGGQAEALDMAAAAEEFQASVRQAIKRLKKSLLPPSKRVKALKKALKQSAVEGAAILLEAALPEQAEGVTPVLPEKKKRKKKKKASVVNEGADAAQAGVGPEAEAKPQRLVRVDGVVLEAKREWVPYEVRTAKLLGLAN